jgi:hypothetical protein
MDIHSLYNIEVIVNYKDFQKSDDTTSDNDNDIEPDTKYREMLLKTFNLSIDDFDSLIDKVDLMYEYIESQSSLFTTQQYDLFNKILVKMAGQFMSEDKKYGILVMFSYDYFDKTHMFLRDLIQNKIINNDILEELENNISQ